MAAAAAAELAAGRPVETAALVISLRDFIRRVLDLLPVPSELVIPKQGPSRTISAKAGKESDKNGAKQGGGGGSSGRSGGASGGSGGAVPGGSGYGHDDEDTEHHG